MNWQLFIARYVVRGEAAPTEIPDIASQLLAEGYDSKYLRLAAGEDWRSLGITDLFRQALHEIGLLPVPPEQAALTLMRYIADGIRLDKISEFDGIHEIWEVIRLVPSLCGMSPFDDIVKTKSAMWSYWLYHAEHNKTLVREYADRILKEYGEESDDGGGHRSVDANQ